MDVAIHIDERQLDITHLHGNKYIDLFSRQRNMSCQSICLETGESVNPWAVNLWAWSLGSLSTHELSIYMPGGWGVCQSMNLWACSQGGLSIYEPAAWGVCQSMSCKSQSMSLQPVESVNLWACSLGKIRNAKNTQHEKFIVALKLELSKRRSNQQISTKARMLSCGRRLSNEFCLGLIVICTYCLEYYWSPLRGPIADLPYVHITNDPRQGFLSWILFKPSEGTNCRFALCTYNQRSKTRFLVLNTIDPRQGQSHWRHGEVSFDFCQCMRP